MQTKIFLHAALFSAISLVIADPAPQPGAQTTTPPSAAQVRANFDSTLNHPPYTNFTLNSQISKEVHDLDVYAASLTAAPQWPSITSVLATAFASVDDYTIDNLSSLTSIPEFTAMPKNVQDYVISVNKAIESIISKDLSGAAPKPTGAVMAAGAAAAGLLGVVAML